MIPRCVNNLDYFLVDYFRELRRCIFPVGSCQPSISVHASCDLIYACYNYVCLDIPVSKIMGKVAVIDDKGQFTSILWQLPV